MDPARVIVLDVVGLQRAHVSSGLAPNIGELLAEDRTAPLEPPFPAVTIPAQTTLATGRAPGVHGDVMNGEYARETDSVALWERERETRRRLWEAVTEDTALTTGVLFCQRLRGTTADVAVTPAPIEDANNELLEMHCWTNPDGFYDDLRADHGHFPLHNYWGPAANAESTRWILSAARAAIERSDPDLLWVYVPHLDYAGQRAGPESEAFREAVDTVDSLVGEFLRWLADRPRWSETVVSVLSEYGFHEVSRPVFPNRALGEAGLLHLSPTRDGETNVDLASSSAFALVDHQVAHVFTDHPERAASALSSLDGVARVLDMAGKADKGIDHPNAGELVLVAERDAWFQYYWWDDGDAPPPYATDVDIHAKPGFDPCELFLGETGMVSLDPTRVGGSHGRVDPDTFGVFGLGGPAGDDLAIGSDVVDARRVAPTIVDLLGIREELSLTFRTPGVLPD